MFPWVTFNDIDYFSNENNITVTHIEITELVKRNVTVKTPFVSGYLDMSYVLHDKNTYEPRTIKVEIAITQPTPTMCQTSLDIINSMILDVTAPLKVKTYLSPEKQFIGKVISQKSQFDEYLNSLIVTYDILVQPSVYRLVEEILFDEMNSYTLIKASRLKYTALKDQKELLWLYKASKLFIDTSATIMTVNDVVITLNSIDKWYADLPLASGDNFLSFNKDCDVTLKYEIEVI